MGLKTGNFATAIIVGSLLTATPALTQESTAPHPATSKGAPTSDLPLADYQAFDNFAVAHPEIISELSRHPELFKNDEFLSKHPELRDFLASHAELRASLIEDPGNFLAPNSRHQPLQ